MGGAATGVYRRRAVFKVEIVARVGICCSLVAPGICGEYRGRQECLLLEGRGFSSWLRGIEKGYDRHAPIHQDMRYTRDVVQGVKK